MYKRLSRRHGGTNLTGWSIHNQGGWKNPSKVRRVYNSAANRVPSLTVAEIGNLGVEELLIECVCGHSAILPTAAIETQPPLATLGSISRRLRCEECRAKGSVEIKMRMGHR